MITHLLSIVLFLSSIFSETNVQQQIQGAWKSNEVIVIISGNYFAYTTFTSSEFVNAYGGSWKIEGSNMVVTFEFNTEDPEMVGTSTSFRISVDGNSFFVNDAILKRVDDGSPGKLAGTWLFSNRMRDGKLGSPRSADNPRKTMKILSGTRFQWIAYNVDTKEFMGTGGGTYTTIDGKYTENIDFFSRDNSRVGASLVFDYERKNDEWHHKGFSSKGDPIYEIWSLRK